MKQKYTVFVADLLNDYQGHYHFMQALSKLLNVELADTEEKKILISRHPISGILERIKMFDRIIRKTSNCKEFKIVHFQTVDKFYFIPFLKSIENKNLKIIGTLHRVPKNRILRLLLKNFASKVSRIVVLSDSLNKELNDLGIHNVVTILHPTFYDYSKILREEARRECGISDNTIVISALGGTRFDKGLDLLIEAINMLHTDKKEQVLLNVAGRVQDFDGSYIKENLDSSVKCRLELKTLSNEEFCKNVILSDWVAVPYRSSFTSVSGPMVEALSNKVPIIVPLDSSLEDFASQIGGYISFKSEDTSSLSSAIMKAIDNGKVHVEHSNLLTLDNFLKLHEQMYNDIYERR